MKQKYDRIGTGYNQTRKPDPYLASRLLAHLNPRKDDQYLDIGCGTGNYTITLHQKGVDFIGVEPSKKMLDIAQSRCATIDWKQGQVEAIPLPNQSVDGIMASLTAHHWTNLEKGCQELFRVLKSDKQMVIFTSTAEQMHGYWLNHYFPKMLEKSIEQMPSFLDLKKGMTKAGFQISTLEKYFIHDELEDHFLYVGKNRPELYLNPQMRQGISSFSDLANLEEVENGLIKLKQDLQSGQIQKIIDSYKNDGGDYLFMVLKKP